MTQKQSIAYPLIAECEYPLLESNQRPHRYGYDSLRYLSIVFIPYCIPSFYAVSQHCRKSSHQWRVLRGAVGGLMEYPTRDEHSNVHLILLFVAHYGTVSLNLFDIRYLAYPSVVAIPYYPSGLNNRMIEPLSQSVQRQFTIR
jgi:hypothetical protein